MLGVDLSKLPEGWGGGTIFPMGFNSNFHPTTKSLTQSTTTLAAFGQWGRGGHGKWLGGMVSLESRRRSLTQASLHIREGVVQGLRGTHTHTHTHTNERVNKEGALQRGNSRLSGTTAVKAMRGSPGKNLSRDPSAYTPVLGITVSVVLEPKRERVSCLDT